MTPNDCVHFDSLTARWIVARPCSDDSGRFYGPVHAGLRGIHGDLALGTLTWLATVCYAYASKQSALARAREVYGEPEAYRLRRAA